MLDTLGLQGQAAAVVGGGYGSGRELVLLLAKAGARVAVIDLDADRARKVADEVGGYAVIGDVTTETGANAAIDEAHDRLGGLSRLANIVGGVKMAPFVDTNLAHWQSQLQFNLYQQMLVCHAAGRHMLKAGGGSIAMVASVSGYYGAHNQVAYGAAKAGVMSLARTLAEEWGPHGVRVNTVSPDITATTRVIEAAPGAPQDVLAGFDAMAVGDGVPLRRFGRVHEIAGPLLFLLSDLSSYVTGHNLVVDGGTMVRFPHATVAPPPIRSGSDADQSEGTGD